MVLPAMLGPVRNSMRRFWSIWTGFGTGSFTNRLTSPSPSMRRGPSISSGITSPNFSQASAMATRASIW